MEEPQIAKKRGRKRKEDKLKEENTEEPIATGPKRRGRKPKGGKIELTNLNVANFTITNSNIILHLKCNSLDVEKDINTNELIKYDPSVPPNIKSYYEDNNDYSIYNEDNVTKNNPYNDETVCSICKNNSSSVNNNLDGININEVNEKLKNLKIQLYKNNVNKKSACFWCTCSFDTPTCFVPNDISDDDISGYGSFCSPQCAVSYLFKEDIDDAVKFERYKMINEIYGKVYNYTKNIKPAPNPYYILDKFYGSLTIQEYRKMLGSEHLLVVLDKPMTRHLPELHEDNDHFVSGLYGSETKEEKNHNTGKYKVKRESEKKKGPSKKELIKEHFGL